MRKQEFNSKLISLLPLDEVPVHVPLRRPRPLRFERLPVPVWNPYSRGRLSPAKSEDRKGGEGKTDANLTIFFSTCCAMAPQLARHALGRLPTPPPLPENLLSDCTENCPLRPCEHPGGSESEKSASHSGHSPLRGLGGGLGDASPARRCSPSRTASPPAPLAIRKAPSGRRSKSRRQSHKFFKHQQRLAPQLAATPWGGSPPRPLRQKICYSNSTENCPLRPLRAPRRFRNPKIRQQLGAQPTPRFRSMLDALLHAMLDPLPPFTFCCPQAIVDEDAGV